MNAPAPRVYGVDVGRLDHTPCWRYVFAYSERQACAHFGLPEHLRYTRVLELAYVPEAVDANLCEESPARIMRIVRARNTNGEQTYADEGAEDPAGAGAGPTGPEDGK